ncbi:MAG: hypothetical protein AAFY73_14090 [Pseudomonadota bacterium]
MSELHVDFIIPLPQPFVLLAAFGVLLVLTSWAINKAGIFKDGLLTIWASQEHRGVKAFIVLAALLAPFWLALLLFTLSGTLGLWSDLPTPIDPNDAAAKDGAALAYRMHYIALVGLTGSLVALVGAPLALLRVHTVERQTKAQEEGLVTERINKAVENLWCHAQRLGHGKRVQPHRTQHGGAGWRHLRAGAHRPRQPARSHPNHGNPMRLHPPECAGE